MESESDNLADSLKLAKIHIPVTCNTVLRAVVKK